MKKILSNREYKLVVERSKFLAYSFECKDSETMQEILNKVRSEHHSANHVCFGCVLKDINEYYSSDDGEPSGTAGLPILQSIRECDLIETLVIVVRYFGGIKLGVPGLFRAYKEASFGTLKDNCAEVKLKTLYEGNVDYSNFNLIKNILEKKGINLQKVEFLFLVKFSVYLDNDEIKYVEKYTKLTRKTDQKYVFKVKMQ